MSANPTDPSPAGPADADSEVKVLLASMNNTDVSSADGRRQLLISARKLIAAVQNPIERAFDQVMFTVSAGHSSATLVVFALWLTGLLSSGPSSRVPPSPTTYKSTLRWHRGRKRRSNWPTTARRTRFSLVGLGEPAAQATPLIAYPEQSASCVS